MWKKLQPCVNKQVRLEVARLMAAVCDRQIKGREFARKLFQFDPGPDANLEMAIDWLHDLFQPELSWPDFNIDNPPWRVRRKMALLRRFLISEQSYDWPENSFEHDGYPYLRLITAAFACVVTFVGLLVAFALPSIAIIALPSLAFTIWFLAREPRANRRDWQHAEMRAKEFGDPVWWPFLNYQAFHAVGSVRKMLR